MVEISESAIVKAEQGFDRKLQKANEYRHKGDTKLQPSWPRQEHSELVAANTIFVVTIDQVSSYNWLILVKIGLKCILRRLWRVGYQVQWHGLYNNNDHLKHIVLITRMYTYTCVRMTCTVYTYINFTQIHYWLTCIKPSRDYTEMLTCTKNGRLRLHSIG